MLNPEKRAVVIGCTTPVGLGTLILGGSELICRVWNLCGIWVAVDIAQGIIARSETYCKTKCQCSYQYYLVSFHVVISLY